MKRKSEGGTAALAVCPDIAPDPHLRSGGIRPDPLLQGPGTHAGRDGARWGALYTAPRRTDAEVQTYVRKFLNRVNLTGAAITVSGAAGVQGTRLTVRVDYPYQYVILSQLIGFSSSLTLSAETVMLLE